MRLRGAFVGLFALVGGLFWTFAAVGANGAVAEEGGFTSRVAEERSSAGLAAYAGAHDLVDVARGHARRMASEGRLYHNPSLGSQVQDWEAVGENVGVGASVDDVHDAFMASASHRHAILSTDFTQVGVGVVVGSDGRLWVAQVFRRPAAPAPAPAPAAAPAPASAPARAPKPAPAARPPRPAAPVVDAVASARAADEAAIEAADREARRAAEEEAAAAAAAVAAAEREAAAVRDRLAADLASVGTTPVRPTPVVLSGLVPVAAERGREVTLPVGVATSVLLAVVLGLLAEVGRTRYPLSDWRRQRSQASMSSSRSPSSTAWTLPVS